MRRPGGSTWFKAGEVAEMVGVCRETVWKQIRARKLKAKRLPGHRHVRSRWCIHRDDLVRWLVDNGIPVSEVRRWLQPEGATVILAGVDRPLSRELEGFRPVSVSSLFALGRAMEKSSAWAVVVDLQGVGRDEALAAFSLVSADADRPYLIALLADDEAARPGRAADVFDVVLPRISKPAYVRRAVERLWKSMRGCLTLSDLEEERQTGLDGGRGN